jgi:hypothetical protein
MQVVRRGAAGVIRVTLEESKTLESPYYLFIFSYPNNAAVSIMFNYTDDLNADYKRARYNAFTLPANLFDNQPAGLWAFKVYEVPTNSELQEIGLPIERGVLKLLPPTDDVKTTYTPATQTPTVYNG